MKDKDSEQNSRDLIDNFQNKLWHVEKNAYAIFLRERSNIKSGRNETTQENASNTYITLPLHQVVWQDESVWNNKRF